jgi:ribosomal protein L11 methylase PrmA
MMPIDVITANLSSDLLIEALPNLKVHRWLILSGILLSQKDKVAHAVRTNDYELINEKHRGKWVAILARRRNGLPLARV